LLYQIIREYWPEFQAELASQDKYLPAYITKEFEAYLKCGHLEHGFLRVRCDSCHDEKLVAFSCKKRGFCPSCGARRIADGATLLVDDILPFQPMRQWVLSVPLPLRFLFASKPKAMTGVLGIVYHAISNSVGEVAGFSLHAGVATKANEREKLERLCRYITRPAVSTKRLSMTRNGRVRYELKTPWRNGTTHIIFEPLDFISRLVALVPRPRVNLTRLCRSPHRRVYAHIGTMRSKRIDLEKSADH